MSREASESAPNDCILARKPLYLDDIASATFCSIPVRADLDFSNQQPYAVRSFPLSPGRNKMADEMQGLTGGASHRRELAPPPADAPPNPVGAGGPAQPR